MLFMAVFLCLWLSLQGLTVPFRSMVHRCGSSRAMETKDGENIHEMNKMLKLEIKEIVTSFLVQIIEKDMDIMKVVNPLTLGRRFYYSHSPGGYSLLT